MVSAAFVTDRDVVKRSVPCKKNPTSKPVFRDWYFAADRVSVGYVRIPKRLVGKRIRFRVEEVEDEQNRRRKN